MLGVFLTQTGCVSSGGTRVSQSRSPAGGQKAAHAAKPVLQTDLVRKTRAKAPKQAQLEFASGVKAMEQGNTAMARQVFTRLTKQHPKLSGPYVNLGIMALNAGELDQALKLLTKAAELNPRNAITQNYLGIVYRKQGKFDQAIAAYRKAIQIAPNYPDAYLNLGILHDLYLQKTREAIEFYRKYQSLLPEEDKQVAVWIADLQQRNNGQGTQSKEVTQ